MSKKVTPEATKEKPEEKSADREQSSRRDFLRSLGKWSAILIGAAVGGGLLDTPQSAAWVNGGAAWVNARGGYGGGSWVNGGGGGGAGWVNRAGGGGGAWVNRAGGGGGAWVNRRGY